MSRITTVKTVLFWFETQEKCWHLEHKHEPFVCERCGGQFCRFAETADDDSEMGNECLDCWTDDDGIPPDGEEEP